MSRIPVILIWLAVLGILNGVLYVGQEAYSRRAVANVDSFERQMNIRWSSFLADEARRRQLKAEIDSLRTKTRRLASDIEAIEKQHPDGIPARIYSHYSSLVDEHNGIVRRLNARIGTFNGMIRGWNAQVDAYNEDVARFNQLVSSVPTSRWYLLPGLGRQRGGVRAPKPTLSPAPIRP